MHHYYTITLLLSGIWNLIEFWHFKSQGDGDSPDCAIRGSKPDGAEDEPFMESNKREATTQIEKFLQGEGSERRGSGTQTSPQGLCKFVPLSQLWGLSRPIRFNN